MKKFFHKIMSFAMAIVVLFSTMSFTMNMHYCGDTLVETALFHKAEGCGMEMQKPTIEDCSVTVIKKNCCNDEQLVIDGQDKLQLQIDQISFQQQLFIVSFVYTFNTIFEGLSTTRTSYKAYEPPLVTTQIFKLDETYLI